MYLRDQQIGGKDPGVSAGKVGRAVLNAFCKLVHTFNDITSFLIDKIMQIPALK